MFHFFIKFVTDCQSVHAGKQVFISFLDLDKNNKCLINTYSQLLLKQILYICSLFETDT